MPTAIELADQFQVSLVGDGSHSYRGLAPLERAQAYEISFLSNPLYRQQALDSNAGALIIDQSDLEFLESQGQDRKSTRLNSSHVSESRMPSSA